MSEHVVWYDSSEAGAPVLNNAAGSLIGVLRACLVTGFNIKSVTSIVVASNVATVTCNGHAFSGKYSQDVLIQGASTAMINGRKQPTVVNANTFTFPAPGVADGSVSGTITAKRAPLGWVQQFSGTNSVIFKRSDMTATSVMLRIVDTNLAPATNTDARVFMVESATGINTFAGQAPTQTQLPNGQYWSKGLDTADSKQWALVGTSKGFYLWTQQASLILPGADEMVYVHQFTDFDSLKQGDAFNTMLSGSSYETYGVNGVDNYVFKPSLPSTQGDLSCVVSRNYSQLGSCATILALRPIISGSSAYADSPSVIDAGFVLAGGVPLLEGGTPRAVRGRLPGIYDIYNNKPGNHYQIISNVPGTGGKTLMLMSGQFQGSSLQFAIDLTGPW
jgi:hypothetical protein